MTRRADIAADVYRDGLRLALGMRAKHKHSQSIQDIFGDQFTAWLACPSAPYRSVCKWTKIHRRRQRGVADINARWLAWQTVAAIDGSVKYAARMRMAGSIASSIQKVPEVIDPVLSTWY